MKAFFFALRHAFRWFALSLLVVLLWKNIVGVGPRWIYPLLVFGPAFLALASALSHVQRVRLVTGRTDAAALASRHRRQIEVPLTADETFDILDTAIRELPNVESVDSSRGSLQIRARVRRVDPYMGTKDGPRKLGGARGARRNQVLATVTPAQSTASVTLVCEPEGGAWVDWFMVDDGTNFENAEAIGRALSRRVAERRKGEEAHVRETATEKELTVARLSLLHAQVEPHFLYNTLASAQVLTRTDPMRADQMLGHLIAYLRNSLPRTEETPSTLGDELERTRAYLEILRIRMGDRLRVQVEVPDELKPVAVPAMMLQTLVENAIKHGLEPVPGGGTIWIIARESEGRVAITIADDGRGFSEEGGGTGIGLKNVRERLRLEYGDDASFTIVANFPRGVAATITLPRRSSPSPLGEGAA